MTPGSVFVDHTTVSAKVTRELFETAAGDGIAFVDAPVSGGQAGAENGQLVIMCGGDQADYDRVEPIMNSYAKLCKRLGESGAGHLPGTGSATADNLDHIPPVQTRFFREMQPFGQTLY